jgi:hypothetical protein
MSDQTQGFHCGIKRRMGGNTVQGVQLVNADGQGGFQGRWHGARTGLESIAEMAVEGVRTNGAQNKFPNQGAITEVWQGHCIKRSIDTLRTF